jgi:hypothetical protein
VIAAGDGIYDPAPVNGRLLLGLKGTLSAWERHTMQARLTAGLIHKAQRGAWAWTLPPGLARNGQGPGRTMPTQDAPARLALVFETFVPGRSASPGVAILHRHALRLPRRARLGEVRWKAPRVASVLALLTHPAYAGAFPSGRTRPVRREASQRRPAIPRLPPAQWRICIPHVSPSDSRGETSRQMQAMRKENPAEYARNKTRGMPRPGQALWPGRGSCGAGGPKMVAQDKGGTRYLCHDLRHQSRSPVCPDIAADPGDTRGGEAFFPALSPVARDV